MKEINRDKKYLETLIRHKNKRLLKQNDFVNECLRDIAALERKGGT